MSTRQNAVGFGTPPDGFQEWDLFLMLVLVLLFLAIVLDICILLGIRHTAVDDGDPLNGFQEWETIPARLGFGNPLNGFQEWERNPVYFHGFEGLDASRGAFVKSPEFKCYGHQWSLIFYPGGRRDSDDGLVGVFLCNRPEESIEVEFGFTVKKTNGRDVAECDGSIGKKRFTPFGSSASSGGQWGLKNFAKHSDILSNLVAGSLIIEVRMRRTDPSPFTPEQFIPENPCGKMILKMFTDEESADVVFEVENGDQQAHITFYAHRLILKQWATSVSITDVKPEIFRHMLHFVYGGKVAEGDLKSHAKDIIEAANRFGVANLKLEAEASYVKSTTIEVGN
ncbi:hypothetical protein ACHAXR_000820, partial [Thalassiosira sp. AJA248-18]